MATLEVNYEQEPHDPAFDYSKEYYVWPEGITPSEAWTFAPSPIAQYFWTAFRVTHECIQLLTLEAVSMPSDFHLRGQEIEVQLFKELMHLNPLEHNQDELEVHIGRSRKREAFYMRYPDEAGAIIPGHFLQGFADENFPLDVGVEWPNSWDPTMDTHVEWPVAYFDNPDQASVQQAYDRLTVIHDWLDTLNRRMYKSAERFLKQRLKEVNESGWPERL